MHLTHCAPQSTCVPSLGGFVACEIGGLPRLLLCWDEKIHVGRFAQSALIKYQLVLEF